MPLIFFKALRRQPRSLKAVVSAAGAVVIRRTTVALSAGAASRQCGNDSRSITSAMMHWTTGVH